MVHPADRQYQPNGRPSAVVVSRERTAVPGTPSRKEKQRESSALQDPGLKDYVRFPSTLPGTCCPSPPSMSTAVSWL